MPESLPSSPDLAFVLDHVLPRLGMWTGRATYERAVCFVEGFDFASGSRVQPRMQAWAESRFGETNIGWPWVLIRLSLGITRDVLEGRDLGSLTADEDAAVLALLQQALREVIDHP